MIIKILKAFSITLLSLGFVSLLGVFYLANYSTSHCSGAGCAGAGIAEGFIIMIFSLPLIIVGLIISSIAYLLNRKNQQTQVQDGKINFSRVLFIVAIFIFISSIFVVPGLYVGIYNYSKDFIENIFGL